MRAYRTDVFKEWRDDDDAQAAVDEGVERRRLRNEQLPPLQEDRAHAVRAPHGPALAHAASRAGRARGRLHRVRPHDLDPAAVGGAAARGGPGEVTGG